MMNRGRWIVAVLLASGWVAARSGPAVAAPSDGGPLVVVVESDRPDLTSADAVRRAIANELGRPVVGPQDPLAETAADLLLVRVAADVVTMRFRTAREGGPHRRVDGISSGPAGLKTLAWLAGNLVRDQTGDLLAGAADTTKTSGTAGAASAAETLPERDPNSTLAPQPASTSAATVAPPAVATATARPTAATAPSPPDELDWRFGVTLGSGQRLFSSIYRDVTTDRPIVLDRDVATVRLELLTPRFSRHATAWIGAAYQGGYLTAFGLSAGVVSRWESLPRWLAVELGGGAGFLVGRHAIILFSPGGPLPAMSNIEGHLGGHALANLVFTHWHRLGEGFVGVGANDWWAWKGNPDVAGLAGVRLRLP